MCVRYKNYYNHPSASPLKRRVSILEGKMKGVDTAKLEFDEDEF